MVNNPKVGAEMRIGPHPDWKGTVIEVRPDEVLVRWTEGRGAVPELPNRYDYHSLNDGYFIYTEKKKPAIIL